MAEKTKSKKTGTGYHYINRKYRDIDTNKYSFTQHSYPNDLFGSDPNYGGNYVVFYINVAEDSRLIKNKVEKTVTIEADERYASEFTRVGMTGVGAAASAGAGTAAATTIAGVVAGQNIVDAAESGLKTGAIAAAATGIVAAAADGKMARQTKRLKTAIALHIPNQLNVRYGMNWSDEEMGLLMAGANITDAAQKAFSQKGGSAGASAASAAGSAITSAALQIPKVGAFASAASGLAANPKKEQVFRGVDFRTFQIDYQFFPRDSDEAANVLNIIKEFKLHMHPEFKDTASFLYIYPSEFDIYYYYYSQENKALHRQTSCVLTELNVNYTPNGSFQTFNAGEKSPGGMPTQINLSMTFKELAILTKDQILDGF